MYAHFYINDFVKVLDYIAIVAEVVVTNQIAYKLVNFSGDYLGWVQEVHLIKASKTATMKAVEEWYLTHNKDKRYKELLQLLGNN